MQISKPGLGTRSSKYPGRAVGYPGALEDRRGAQAGWSLRKGSMEGWGQGDQQGAPLPGGRE